MGRKSTLPVAEAIAEYIAGQKVRQIAVKYSVSIQHVYDKLAEHKVQMRPVGADLRTHFDEASAVAEYLKGTSSLECSRKFGVDDATIDRALRDAGVKKRSASEQNYISWTKEPAGYRSATRKAWHAARGKYTPNLSYLAGRARRLQEAGKMTKKEKLCFERIKSLGILTIPQYAVDRYNIDLAVPDARVAIEVRTSGWHLAGSTKDRDERKRALLTQMGWVVLDLSVVNNEWRTSWGEQILSLVSSRRALLLG